LPEATRRRIAGLTCKHDASRNSVGEVRRGFKKVYERRDALDPSERRLLNRAQVKGERPVAAMAA
jgi:hypothetical protein